MTSGTEPASAVALRASRQLASHPLIHLSGPRPPLDPRVNALHPGAVDIALAGSVSAARYVVPVPHQASAARVAMRAEPAIDAVAVSELLFGEPFEVLEHKAGWCWGRTLHDRYLGWVPETALTSPGPPPTHRVTARIAPVFAAASIKATVGAELPLGARLAGVEDGRFLLLADGRFVHLRHVAPLAEPASEPLAVAQAFIGAPYLWGGRTPGGVDCSGLVQAALTAAGLASPRDSDQQLAGLPEAVAFDDRQRGDLVFFPGHVGILAGRDRLLHANAYWMTTLEEPLADVIARLRGDGVAEPVLGLRRPRLSPMA